MNDLLIPNGINGATGGYLLKPQSPKEITAVARQERMERTGSLGPTRILMEGLDPKNLAQAGWGVVFAHAEKEQLEHLKEALAPLISLRREQAGERYREYTGPDAYRPGETAQSFRTRFGMGFGPVDPSKMAYYLLIVADPRSVPFEFQYQLDIQHAVGRIFFDTLDEYNLYAQSVVAAETGKIVRPRRATFFGVHNPGDRATELTADQLIQPLSAWAEKDQPQWQIQTVAPENAQKAQLTRNLGGDQTPALFFGASHGMGFPLGDSRQFPHQGALLCQDWPGADQWQKAIPQDFYLAGDDIGDDAQVAGTIAFFYACYGAGMPQDDYFGSTGTGPNQIADHPFLARLPQRLLAHPRGGALAVIGHVERTWSSSFLWEGSPQIEVFQSALKRLMEGHPTGSALEYFNLRHAELAAALSQRLEVARMDRMYQMLTDEYHYEVAPLWTAHHDARSYIIVGDPAVRLAVGDGTAQVAFQPAIQVRNAAAPGPAAEQERAGAESLAAPNSPQAPAQPAAVVVDEDGQITVTTYVVDQVAGEGERKIVARTTIAPDGTILTEVADGFLDSWPLLTLHGDAIRAAVVDGRQTHRGAVGQESKP